MIVHPLVDATTKLSNFDEYCIQPNGIDLRVENVYEYEISLSKEKWFTLNGKDKKHLKRFPVITDEDDFFNLSGGIYPIVFEGTITIGENEAGFVLPRSTLVRNSCYIFSGLYDSGFHGKMEASLFVGYNFRFKPGERLGQMVIEKATSYEQYNGYYQERK